MIIFPHIQKTAGTNLRLDIEEGIAGNSLSDYLQDYVLSSDINFIKKRMLFKENVSAISVELCNKYNIIYGHFCSDKYNSLKNILNINLITFFREPTERVISHYYYWKKRVELNSFSQEHINAYYQLRLLKENKLSLLDFASSDGIRNIYKLYLGSYTIKDFSFIGLTERFDESIKIINNRYNTKFTNRRDNITDKSNYDPDIKSVYNELKKINEENYYYYNLAIQEFWNK